MTTDKHIAGELYGLSAHPGDIYHRAAMTVEALVRERDGARAAALEEAAKVVESQRIDLSGPYDADPENYAEDEARVAAVAAIRALKEPT
jgi:hypothetical protein